MIEKIKNTLVKKVFIWAFFIFLLSFWFIGNGSLAQQNQLIIDNQTWTKIKCEDKFSFQWPYDIKKDVSSYFFISENWKHNPIKTDFAIFFQGKLIHTQVSLSWEMRYSFDKIWTYEIKTKIYNWKCIYQKSKIIRVYKDTILYIGNFLQDFNFWLLDNIQQNDFLVSTIIINKDKSNDLNMEENIIKKQNYIKQSKYIFLNNVSLSNTFDIITKLKNEIKNFNKKKIFIISNNDENLTKKFIASKIHKQNLNNIYTISYKNFRDVMVSLSIGNANFKLLEKQKPVATKVKEQKRSFGGLIDMLIFYGVNIQFIEMAFISIIAILIIVFFKQIIWLPWYWLFFPIIGSLLLFNIPLHFFVMFLFVAYISHFLSKYVTEKITLLVYAKLGLYISVYTIISLIWFIIYFSFAYNFLEPITFSTNVLISWFLIWVIAKKIISEIKNIKTWLINSFWFIFLVWWIFQLFHFSWLQNFVLLNPSIIFLCILLIILIWRFTWLMIVEYIRFWPFIKNKVFKKKSKKM